jgi:hypothetical protein
VKSRQNELCSNYHDRSATREASRTRERTEERSQSLYLPLDLLLGERLPTVGIQAWKARPMHQPAMGKAGQKNDAPVMAK